MASFPLRSEKFGQGDMQMVVAVTSDAGVVQARRAVGADLVSQLEASPYVADVKLGVDHVAAGRAGNDQQGRQDRADRRRHHRRESGAQKHAKALANQLVHDRDGVTVRASGDAMTYVQINDQSEKDLLLMESIAIPLSFVVLVWVFGGLLAAALPLAVGGFAILSSMAVLRAITSPPTCRSSR